MAYTHSYNISLERYRAYGAPQDLILRCCFGYLTHLFLVFSWPPVGYVDPWTLYLLSPIPLCWLWSVLSPVPDLCHRSALHLLSFPNLRCANSHVSLYLIYIHLFLAGQFLMGRPPISFFNPFTLIAFPSRLMPSPLPRNFPARCALS